MEAGYLTNIYILERNQSCLQSGTILKISPSLYTFLGAKKRKMNFKNSKKRKFRLKIPSSGNTTQFWRISSLLLSATWMIVE
jgi:hypothetical protein